MDGGFLGGSFLGVVGGTACIGGFGCWLWGFSGGMQRLRSWRFNDAKQDPPFLSAYISVSSRYLY